MINVHFHLDEKNYQEDAVKVMNAFRKIHDSPPLTVNNNLHAKAKQRADSFVTGLVKRSERKQKPGENVQVACNPIDKVLPPEEAIGNLLVCFQYVTNCYPSVKIQ